MEFINLYEWCQTVTPDQLPECPFALSSTSTIVDKAVWLHSLQGDARRGPNAARAKWGALQQDLRDLYALVRG